MAKLSKSQQMARVNSKNTRVELQLRTGLWRAGIRYRLHATVEGCKPDLVLARFKLAIFIDGCFWHGCPVHYSRPGTRPEFWAKKLRTNVTRDIAQTSTLRASGWRVVRFWEHEVLKTPESCVAELVSIIREERTDRFDTWRVIEVLAVDGAMEDRCMVRVDDPAVVEWRRVAHVTGAGRAGRKIS